MYLIERAKIESAKKEKERLYWHERNAI